MCASGVEGGKGRWKPQGENCREGRKLKWLPGVSQGRESSEASADQIPFGHQGNGREYARRRKVESCVGCASKRPLINPPAPAFQCAQNLIRVHPSCPSRLTGGVVLFRPLSFQ